MSQTVNKLFAFKVVEYNLFDKKNNINQLVYSSILMGKIIIGDDNGSFYLHKSDRSELKMIDLKNGKLVFYNNYETNDLKTSINIVDLENDFIEIKLENQAISIVYKLIKINDEQSIYSSISSGTAFFIDSIHLITNYHVVANSTEIRVYIKNRYYNCQILKYDSILDLALLKINEFKSKYWAVFKNDNPEIGDDCYSLGYPLSNLIGENLKFTSGIISSINGFKDNPNFFQITTPIDPGNSGGPLLDQDGCTIGIITAKFAIGTNIGYAIKGSIIKKFCSIKSFNCLNSKISPKEIFNKNSNSTFLIKNYVL